MNRKFDWKKVSYKTKYTLTVLFTMFSLFMMNANCIFASSYGKNASDWINEQLFYIALAALVFLIVMQLIKRNLSGTIVTILGGGVILYFIDNPTKISDIGEKIAKIIIG